MVKVARIPIKKLRKLNTDITLGLLLSAPPHLKLGDGTKMCGHPVYQDLRSFLGSLLLPYGFI